MLQGGVSIISCVSPSSCRVVPWSVWCRCGSDKLHFSCTTVPLPSNALPCSTYIKASRKTENLSSKYVRTLSRIEEEELESTLTSLFRGATLRKTLPRTKISTIRNLLVLACSSSKKERKNNCLVVERRGER